MGQLTWAGLPACWGSWMDLKAGKFTYLAGDHETIQTATDWHNRDPLGISSFLYVAPPLSPAWWLRGSRAFHKSLWAPEVHAVREREACGGCSAFCDLTS